MAAICPEGDELSNDDFLSVKSLETNYIWNLNKNVVIKENVSQILFSQRHEFSSGLDV